jgi:hypothetical protein
LSTTRTRRIGAAAGAAAVLAAGVALASPSAAQIPDADLLGLRRDNQLVRFDPATPGTTTITPVTGIGADTLIGIDTRPNGNVLYGYALDGTIYTIDPVSGAATEVASASAAPTPASTSTRSPTASGSRAATATRTTASTSTWPPAA